MSKVALERVTSSFGFQAAFNDTLAKIESEFTDKVLYRDNPVGTTNEMKNDLDMGTHDVLNVKMVDAQQVRVGGVDLDDVVNQLIDDLNTIPAETMGYRDEAIAARNAANLSAIDAGSSEATALQCKNDIIDLFADYTLDGLHTHTNKAVLDGTQKSFTTALKTKLDGIQAGAQVNANITKAEIEAKLTGVISTHSHSSAVSPNSITNTELADMAVSTIKGRATAGTGDPEDLTASQVRTILNVADGAQKNSDITKAEIEAKLTGTISTHTHNIEPFPIGSISFHASSTAPSGFLKCNGANVSRTTYADLFAIIGTAFGTGDGSTTFTLPDLRGEFVRGWDNGRGVDTSRVFGSAQADAFASHRHGDKDWFYYHNDQQSYHGPGSIIPHLTYSGHMYYANRGGSVSAAVGGTETRPRNIALLACIRY